MSDLVQAFMHGVSKHSKAKCSFLIAHDESIMFIQQHRRNGRAVTKYLVTSNGEQRYLYLWGQPVAMITAENRIRIIYNDATADTRALFALFLPAMINIANGCLYIDHMRLQPNMWYEF